MQTHGAWRPTTLCQPCLLQGVRTVESVVRPDGGRNGGFYCSIRQRLCCLSISFYILSFMCRMAAATPGPDKPPMTPSSFGSSFFHLFLPKEAAVGASISSSRRASARDGQPGRSVLLQCNPGVLQQIHTRPRLHEMTSPSTGSSAASPCNREGRITNCIETRWGGAWAKSASMSPGKLTITRQDTTDLAWACLIVADAPPPPPPSREEQENRLDRRARSQQRLAVPPHTKTLSGALGITVRLPFAAACISRMRQSFPGLSLHAPMFRTRRRTCSRGAYADGPPPLLVRLLLLLLHRLASDLVPAKQAWSSFFFPGLVASLLFLEKWPPLVPEP